MLSLIAIESDFCPSSRRFGNVGALSKKRRCSRFCADTGINPSSFRLVLNGGERVFIPFSDGTFVLDDLKPGAHILEVASVELLFPVVSGFSLQSYLAFIFIFWISILMIIFFKKKSRPHLFT